MKTVRLKGPMESIGFKHGGRKIEFERLMAHEVDDEFADELIGKNPDNLTVEQAAPYCVPVFELVEDAKGASRKTGGEEVGG